MRRGGFIGAGHPEMFFELDGQMVAEPPHWKDEGTWLGPRAWLTGQADVMAIPKAAGEAHLRENFASQDLVLTDADRAEIDAAFPPPKRATALAMR